MVICLERGADLHMFQLMPLPLTISCFSTIQIGFAFLVPAHLGSPGERAVKRVCVCWGKMTATSTRWKRLMFHGWHDNILDVVDNFTPTCQVFSGFSVPEIISISSFNKWKEYHLLIFETRCRDGLHWNTCSSKLVMHCLTNYTHLNTGGCCLPELGKLLLFQ